MKKVLLCVFACALSLTTTVFSQDANAQTLEHKVNDLLIGTSGMMVYNVLINNSAIMDALQARTLSMEDAKKKADAQAATLKYVIDQVNAVIELQADTKVTRSDKKFYESYKEALSALYRQAQAIQQYTESKTSISKTRYDSMTERATSAVNKVMVRE